jgi:hypothetical protein
MIQFSRKSLKYAIILKPDVEQSHLKNQSDTMEEK